MAAYEALDVEVQKAQGPSVLDSLTELPRTLFEATCLGFSWLPLLSTIAKGDGHPVMVLPGFTAGDESTLALRRFLTQLNYKSLPWLQGQNTGDPKLLEGVMRRFYRLHHATGAKLSLVGQSLGGVYAREIAREFPEAVRCVVTLGSPFAAQAGASTNPMIEKLFEQMSGVTVQAMRDQMSSAGSEEPLAVPATSIYSKEDGVVHWSACIEPETALSESVRVVGSHSGMAMNMQVLTVIADRLAQNPDNWQRFDLNQGCRRMLYPRT